MPETTACLRDARELIVSAMTRADTMLALVCSRAPATEVALAATVLRGLCAELDRLRLAAEAVGTVWDEALAAGIATGRCELLAEQAAALEDPPRLRLVAGGS